MNAAARPRLSVVIRAKDEAPSIGRTLALLDAQTLRHETEVIVVDSGSTDGTADIARDAGAEVIEIPAASFTFGGALNTGSERARGELVVALSAHAFPLDDEWLARLAGCFEDERVACASGNDYAPDGGPLRERMVQDAEMHLANCMWGYSNAAGAFRRDLWEQHRFRADMPGTEDKEWAYHWQQRGYLAVIGHDLVVDHGHGRDPLREQYVRARREWIGYGMYLDLEPWPLRAAVRTWWTDQEGYRNATRARLSHRRLARLAGRYAGQRRVSSSR